MSYKSVDNSVEDSAPIECYKFIGELATYRYTNSYQQETVNSELYLPLSDIKRSAAELSSVLESVQTTDVIVPFNTDVAMAYCFLKLPLTLSIEIRSVHRGTNFATEWKMEYQGDVVNYEVSDNYCTFKLQQLIQSSLNKQLNHVYYQSNCNHVLYDDRCKINKTANTKTSTVTLIKGINITVLDDGFNDNDLVVGELICSRTNERRIITKNASNIVTVGYAFIDLRIGDTVQLIRGCDHSYNTCKDKFNNVANFGGFKWLPTTNPYESKI